MNPKEIERIPKEQWLNSHLSVARFTGAITISGVKYVVHPVSEDLVREDVYKAETKPKKPRRDYVNKQLSMLS